MLVTTGRTTLTEKPWPSRLGVGGGTNHLAPMKHPLIMETAISLLQAMSGTAQIYKQPNSLGEIANDDHIHVC